MKSFPFLQSLCLMVRGARQVSLGGEGNRVLVTTGVRNDGYWNIFEKHNHDILESGKHVPTVKLRLWKIEKMLTKAGENQSRAS